MLLSILKHLASSCLLVVADASIISIFVSIVIDFLLRVGVFILKNSFRQFGIKNFLKAEKVYKFSKKFKNLKNARNSVVFFSGDVLRGLSYRFQDTDISKPI